MRLNRDKPDSKRVIKDALVGKHDVEISIDGKLAKSLTGNSKPASIALKMEVVSGSNILISNFRSSKSLVLAKWRWLRAISKHYFSKSPASSALLMYNLAAFLVPLIKACLIPTKLLSRSNPYEQNEIYH